MRPHLATLVEDYRRHGGQPAVVVHRGIRGQRFSYANLAELSRRFASELIRRRINPGERVVLWGHNSAQWIGAFFGCVLRGALVVPLDASGRLDFAQRVFAETQPRLLVADRDLLSRLSGSAEPPRMVLEDFSAVLPEPPASLDLQEPSLGLDTPLQILFTSGATSEPKGIVHTHRNILASLEPIEREMQKYLRYERLVHPLRILHTLPLSHVFGQFMGLWIPPLMAAEVHFESRLQAPRLLELIRRERVSVLASVPRVIELLRLELLARFPDLPARLEAARGQKLARRWWSFREVHRALGLKFWALVCGGASLAGSLESFWRDLGLAVIQGYGMTETAALITLNHPFHLSQGSIGKPLPGREVRIGADGEVLVRGEMVSRARWQSGRITTVADPWLATGDLAEQDEEGKLHFRGRKSETIVTAAGLNIHPEDVEAALNRQPGVDASAVVALQTSAGAEPVAVVVWRNDAQQLPSAIEAANASLAEYQRVRRWMRWPQLEFPRTSLGKIQRHKIAHWVATEVAAQAAADVPMAGKSTQAADPVAELIARIARNRLDLDSLGRVQLQAELEERLGVTIPDEKFEQMHTLAELQAGLQSAVMKHAPATAAPALADHRDAQRYVYPEWPLWAPVQALRLVFQETLMRQLVWLLAAPSISRARVPAPDRPLLIIANHVTFLDAALVLYALPWPMRRKVAIAMSGETLEDLHRGRNWGNWFVNLVAPLGYWAITTLFNVFPLPPGAGFRRSFAHAGWAMDRGYHVLIFPEGTRSPDGTLRPFRSGIGLLAREAQAQILPVALVGLGELNQRKRSWRNWSWFRSGLLRIRVGHPLAPKVEGAPELIADSLRNMLASMLRG